MRAGKKHRAGDDNAARIAESFREAIRKTGITQAELCERITKVRGRRMSPPVLSRMLGKSGNMTLGSMIEIAHALGCRLDIRVGALPDKVSLSMEVPAREKCFDVYGLAA